MTDRKTLNAAWHALFAATLLTSAAGSGYSSLTEDTKLIFTLVFLVAMTAWIFTMIYVARNCSLRDIALFSLYPVVAFTVLLVVLE